MITVVDSNFSDNAANYGAGLYIDANCYVTIADTVLLANDANEEGGAVYASDSTISVADCNISYNTAIRGAGLYCTDSSAHVSRCIVGNNTALRILTLADINDPNSSYVTDSPTPGTGGGLYCFSSDVLVEDSVITGNAATGSAGGVYLAGYKTPGSGLLSELRNCLIYDNRAGRDGGGVSCNWYFETLISNCTIAHNMATDPNACGGGLHCSYNSDVNVVDSIIWGNRATRGAQLAVGSGHCAYQRPSALTITHTDIGPPYDPNYVYDFDTVDILNPGSGTTGSDKVVDGQLMYDGFAAGQERVKAIVSLHEPVQMRTTTDWDSTQSVDLLRAEIAQRQSAVLDTLSPAEFTLRYQYENQAAFSGEVTSTGLAWLAANPMVARIEPARQVKKMLAQAIPLANALEARRTYDGNGIAVAIVDSGVDYTHPMLGDGGFPNAKVIGGYDVGDGDPDPMPGVEAHGTACAGIAAGSLGTVGDYIGGVAPAAKIYALKASPDDLAGAILTDAALAAWDWCITHQNDDPQNPIMVISNSWGSLAAYNDVAQAEADYPAMTMAANIAADLGITILASSGNEFSTDGICSPAALGAVISVGAVYDTTDQVTDYSNTDEILDILAPADPVYTTDIVGAGGYTDGDYTSFAGTSSACPFAAGAVASLQHAALTRLGACLAPAEVRQLLVDTGHPVTDTKIAITKPRVDLGAAIAALTFGPPIYIEKDCTLNGWVAPDSNTYDSWDHVLWPDSYNMQQDPNFVAGYYLSQPPDQNITSACVDAGSALAEILGLSSEYTTCTDGSEDLDMVDMGYHYLIASMPQLTCLILDANGQTAAPAHAHGEIYPQTSRLYPANTVVPLNADPEYGYRVRRWSGTDNDSTTDPNNTVTMTESRLVTVQFEPIPVHQLTTVVLGGHGTILPASGPTFEGRIPLLAIPDPNYRVQKWTGTDYDDSTELNNVVTLDRDKVVIVSFELPQIIEVSGDPNAIQAAIDEAKDGDLLIVAPGVYDANINLLGKAITVTSTNPDDPNVVARTIIDCALASRGFIFNSGEDANTIVDGFTVINGSVTGQNGGGIYVDSNSAPTVRNLIIRNCSAAANEFGIGGNGGGIYVDVNTAPVFIACTVINCTADSNGGGVRCQQRRCVQTLQP
jgi:subtilisin family serine protease